MNEQRKTVLKLINFYAANMRLPFGSESKLGWVIKLGTQWTYVWPWVCAGSSTSSSSARQRLGHILLNTLRTGRLQQVHFSSALAETRAAHDESGASK